MDCRSFDNVGVVRILKGYCPPPVIVFDIGTVAGDRAETSLHINNHMKNIKYYIAAAIVVLGVGVASAAFANPFYTGTRAVTATATSTQAYLRPGLATSTLPIYDSYETGGTNQTNSGNNTIPNTVTILLDGAASSTASVVSATCEFSDNYSPSTGNGDWYQNEIFSTTTVPQNIGIVNSFQFTYASSTVGAAGVPANTNRFQKLITCPVPLRYVRLVVSASGNNSSIWAAIIPTKQRN